MTTDNTIEVSNSEAAVLRYWAGRCRKCRMEIGHHRSTCEDYDLESANNQIKYLEAEITRHWSSRKAAYQERARWEAKFRQVAHENNQLRRALHQQ